MVASGEQDVRPIVLVLLLAGGVGACATPSPPAARRPPSATGPVAAATDEPARFAAAYARFRAGDMPGAQILFRSLLDGNPALADYHLYFLGISAAATGNTTESSAAFHALIDAYPASVWRPDAQLELGRRDRDAGRLAEATALLEDASAAPRRQTAVAARLALGDVREARGDAARAAAEYTAARREAPGSAPGNTAKRRLAALRAAHPDLEPTGEAALNEARLCLAEGDAAGAEHWAVRGAAETSGPTRTAAIRVQADALVRQQRLDEAVTRLHDLAAREPRAPAAPAALTRAATVLWNRDRDAEAAKIFDQVVRRYPDDPRASEALYAIGRIHQAAGDDEAAIAAYTLLTTNYPASTQTPDARWRVGWIHYTAGNWHAAAAAFAAAATDDSGASALYWQGRALEKGGDRAAAAAIYRRVLDREPDGYYAMWAQVRLDGRSAPPDIATRTSIPLAVAANPPAPSPDAFAAAHRFHADRWYVLHHAGAGDLARGELDAIRRADGNEASTARLLIPAYAAVDGYSTALSLLRQPGVGDGFSPTQQRRLQYPLAYWETVRNAAELHGIDPLVVLAIMRQESRFDPEARSAADAYGLLQLLPATAARVAARDPSLPRPDADRLTDPAVNVPIAVAYLAQLFSELDGDLLKVTAAYNGGEAAVARWQRRFGALPPDEFVENISYRETRDYVKRVVGNYRAYRSVWTR